MMGSVGPLFSGALIVLIGAVFVVAAVLRWPWFMRLRKVRRTYHYLGQTGATVFYAAIGLFAIIVGVVSLFRNWI